MRLSEYTSRSCLLPRLDCADHAGAVRRLVDALAAAGDVRESAPLVAAILRREREAGTATGAGLSIPHAQSAEVRRLVIAAATLVTPLDLPSPDGRPVDVVVLIAGPRQDPRFMLRLLARLARVVKHSPFLDLLRAAATPEEMWRVFVAETSVGEA